MVFIFPSLNQEIIPVLGDVGRGFLGDVGCVVCVVHVVERDLLGDVGCGVRVTNSVRLVKVLLKSYSGRSWFLHLSWARGGFPCKNVVSPLLFPQLYLLLLYCKHAFQTVLTRILKKLKKNGRHN